MGSDYQPFTKELFSTRCEENTIAARWLGKIGIVFRQKGREGIVNKARGIGQHYVENRPTLRGVLTDTPR